MVLDVANANDCQTAHFDINAAAGGDARSWDIKVTQYGCGNEDRGGKYCQFLIFQIGRYSSYQL